MRCSGLVSATEASTLLFLNESGQTAATTAGHSRAWDLWVTFLNQRLGEGDTDPDALMHHRTAQERGILLTLWAHWLRDSQQTTSDKIPGLLSNLKGNWTTTNLGNLLKTLTKDESQRIAKAMRPSEDEIRAKLAKKRATQKFPMCSEMLPNMYVSHFLNLFKNRRELAVMDVMGAYVGAVLTMETAQRGSNWVGQHACKTMDIRIQLGVGDSELGVTEQVIGEEARAKLMGDRDRESLTAIREASKQVSRIDFDFLVNKQKVPSKSYIKRRTKEEEKIIELICVWLVISNTKDGDPFLTRYLTTPAEDKRKQSWLASSGGNEAVEFETRWSRRYTNSSDCTKIIKESAVRLGLPPVHFSMRSLRSGAITCLNSAGVDQEIINNLAGHSQKADTSKKFYNHFTSQAGGGRGESIGPSAVSDAVTFNIDKLTQLLPAQSNQAQPTHTTEEKLPTKKNRTWKNNKKKTKTQLPSSSTKQI
jgi:hypothetical protein